MKYGTISGFCGCSSPTVGRFKLLGSSICSILNTPLKLSQLLYLMLCILAEPPESINSCLTLN